MSIFRTAFVATSVPPTDSNRLSFVVILMLEKSRQPHSDRPVCKVEEDPLWCFREPAAPDGVQ